MEEFVRSNFGIKSLIGFDDYLPNEFKVIYLDLVSKNGIVLEPAAEAVAAQLCEVYRERVSASGNRVARRNQ